RIVELGALFDVVVWAAVGGMLGGAMDGKRLANASAAVAQLPEQAPPRLRDVLVRVATVLVETLVEHPEERLVLGGTANLTRNAADFGFPGSLRAVLEALEEQVVVLKLLAAAQQPGTVTVRIGEETQVEQMR
ncbi:HrcA family transcriptional regulator, partial [Nocardia farcinica]|uniref:HrcA family transcriptional regulator n=1 Tax=Nocardia farcinica TaxID=37329 RepID=UPI0034DB07E8